MDIISRIKAALPTLSPTEAKIGEYILANMEFAVHASITDLAEVADVSSPSITRFCRSLNCDGLKQLKVEMAQAQIVGQRYLQKPYTPDDVPAISHNVLAGLKNAVQELEQQLDYVDIDKAADFIVNANRVAIFGGGGGGGMVAIESENRLFRLGVQVNTYTDSQLQTMMAATLNENDVLFVISTSGRFQGLIDTAKVAKQYNCKIVSLTKKGTPLADISDCVLHVDIEENDDILIPTASRYALLALVDIVATAVAAKLETDASERLRRIKYQLVTNREGQDEGLPLGD